MIRFSPSPQVGLSVALGLLLASASGPAGAVWSADDEATATRHFELVPTGRAAQLPPELRAQGGQPSLAEALGLPEAAGRHTVQLHWVVREGAGLSGYRVTLVAADGLPGNLAARWWVAPGDGVPVGDGLTAYSAEIALALDEPAPVAAAVEAIDLSGHAVLLGVRRSVVEADPESRHLLPARSESLSAEPPVLQTSRLVPTACAAPATTASYPSLAAARLAAPPTTLPAILQPGGAVSPRGPPTETVTT